MVKIQNIILKIISNKKALNMKKKQGKFLAFPVLSNSPDPAYHILKYANRANSPLPKNANPQLTNVYTKPLNHNTNGLKWGDDYNTNRLSPSKTFE